MREPTSEEMVNGIAAGVRDFLSTKPHAAVTDAVAKGVLDYLRLQDFSSASSTPMKHLERGAEKALKEFAESYPRDIVMAIGNASAAALSGTTGSQPSARETMLLDVLQEFLCDQEGMKEPYRNEAICERARAILKASGRL